MFPTCLKMLNASGKYFFLLLLPALSVYSPKSFESADHRRGIPKDS